MGYYLGVDIGSVNAKLALIDEKGRVVQFDTEKVASSPRAAVSALIASLALKYCGTPLQEISYESLGV
jgi:predicted NBD/HSP70 family sugar kinase